MSQRFTSKQRYEALNAVELALRDVRDLINCRAGSGNMSGEVYEALCGIREHLNIAERILSKPEEELEAKFDHQEAEQMRKTELRAEFPGSFFGGPPTMEDIREEMNLQEFEAQLRAKPSEGG
jgi:hypothetical protein